VLITDLAIVIEWAGDSNISPFIIVTYPCVTKTKKNQPRQIQSRKPLEGRNCS